MTMSSDIKSFNEKGPRTNSLRPVTLLLPLLGLYLAVALLASKPHFEGDEGGYVGNASRMLGRQDPTTQDLRLWWGPGYPLVLVPFLALRLPWIAAKCLNAGFLFGAILYFFGLLRRYLAGPAALMTTLALGLYPPLMRELHQLIAECLTLLLICGFMFHFCALYNNVRRFRLHLVAASAHLGYLALTKVFFGYVISVVLIFWLGLLLWRRTSELRTACLVFLLALIWCIPYLWHTHSLTGRTFYWGTSGGLSLYWMSAPYPGELGSWYSNQDVKEMPELAPHREFFARLEGLSDVDVDNALRKQAIANILHHPRYFGAHWAANVGRLLFSYPYSYTPQRLTTYFFLAPNMFVVVLFLFSLFPAVQRPKAIPFEMWALLIFAGIAFGGSTLLSAYDRQFWPLVPILCAWMGFVYIRLLKIEFRKETNLATMPVSEHAGENETFVNDRRLTVETQLLG
jgi:hypothetical protein